MPARVLQRPPKDLEERKWPKQRTWAGIPDARAEVEEIFASGDWVGARLRWSGTHTGEFLGLAPTGKTFSITEIEIVRCESGRVVDLRNVFDIESLMAQLSD